MSLRSQSSRLRSKAIFCFVAIPFLCCEGSSARAEYDPVLDYGIVDGYPEILWLQDHGDLTGCCLILAGVPDTGFLRPVPIKARVDSVLNNRDFMYVFSSGYPGGLAATPGSGAAVYLRQCQTEISGLDGPGLCSSNDTFQGLIMMGFDPEFWATVQESFTRKVLIHELGHRWGALCFTTTPGTNIGYGHWFRYNVGGGDYFDIDSIMADSSIPGTWFDVLDLYLMGLADPSEVPDHNYYPDVGAPPIPVTIQSIIDGTGVRNPAYPDAPTNFTVAFVVVTPEGQSPLTADIANIEYWRSILPDWWAEATDYRSTLDITLNTCGNGVVEFGEECDDGNAVNGDGCTSDCVDEAGIPTVSTWGIVVMTLLTLCAGSIIMRRGTKRSAAIRLPTDL